MKSAGARPGRAEAPRVWASAPQLSASGFDDSGWYPADETRLQKLNSLAPQSLTVRAHAVQQGGETIVSVQLENPGSEPALAAKLTALDARGNQVLPVVYSDNYRTLLPYEPREVDIRCPDAGAHCARIQVRGWNIQSATITVGDSR